MGEEAEELEEQAEEEAAEKVKNPYELTPEQQKGFDHQLARVKREAKEMGKRAVLEELGIDNPAEIKELLEEAKKRQDNETSEQERVLKENERLKQQLATVQAETQRQALEGRVRDTLIEAGVPAKQATKVRAMVTGLEPTAEDEAIADAVNDLKEEFPNLFEQGSSEPKQEEEDIDPRTGYPRNRTQGPPASDTGRPPRQPVSKGDPKKVAVDLLHERHPHLTRS